MQPQRPQPIHVTVNPNISVAPNIAPVVQVGAQGGSGGHAGLQTRAEHMISDVRRDMHSTAQQHSYRHRMGQPIRNLPAYQMAQMHQMQQRRETDPNVQRLAHQNRQLLNNQNQIANEVRAHRQMQAQQ